MNRILIVRLGSLGDIVHALPAVAALRRAWPDARIDWLVDAQHRELLDLVPAIDDAVVLRAPTLRGWLDVTRALRAQKYRVAIDLQGLLKSAVLARASGAPRVVGFSIWHLRERTARPFYSETAAPDEALHVVRKNLALVAALGVPAERLEFPLDARESPALADVRRVAGGGPFALVNPGAAWPNKRWPPDRFGALAAILRHRFGLTPFVLWGPGEEPLARAVAGASNGTALVAPRTTISDLVELSRAASLMISGDTGPIHIAAAVGAPIVGLYGPTSPARNGPWAPADVCLSRFDACRCHHRRRCTARAWCLEDITVADVAAAVERR
ncbi:MAG: glycosyltransferase family 9 protein, partial [Vicinamibacterales bacterium]